MKKQNIAVNAEKELNKWTGKVETDSSMHADLVKYWRAAGWSWVSAQNIPQFDNEYPWSAAFICYVVQQSFPNFPKTPTHSGYVVWARDRKDAGEINQVAYEIGDYKPVPGDIVVKKRGYNGNLHAITKTAKTHGDIVTENNGDYLTVIGGNVSHTVRETIVPAKDGYINNSDWIAVIKM